MGKWAKKFYLVFTLSAFFVSLISAPAMAGGNCCAASAIVGCLAAKTSLITGVISCATGGKCCCAATNCATVCCAACCSSCMCCAPTAATLGIAAISTGVFAVGAFVVGICSATSCAGSSAGTQRVVVVMPDPEVQVVPGDLRKLHHHILKGSQFYVNGQSFEQSKKIAQGLTEGSFDIHGNEVLSKSTSAVVATLTEISKDDEYDFQDAIFRKAPQQETTEEVRIDMPSSPQENPKTK